MDFELSEELIAARDLARDFAAKEIAPTAAADDREHKFRRDLIAKMGALGFYGAAIPEEHGGNGLGFLALSLITEEIARAHSAIRVFVNMQVGPALVLDRFGSDAQRKRWLPPLIQGEKVGCFAITEADVGSGVGALRTTRADAGRVYAVTDKAQKHRRIPAFIADFTKPGVSRRELEVMGTHASPLGELTFENFRVPADSLIGKEGEGFKICMWQLNNKRLSCAAGALGLTVAAREAAVSY